VPKTPPLGTEYAWVMASAWGFTQVGWAWTAGGQPYVFAYSDDGHDMAGCQCNGTWYVGPELAPGSSLTVEITRHGDTYTDWWLGDGDSSFRPTAWQPVASATLPGPLVWETFVESYGPMENAFFTAQSYLSSKGWVELGPVCFGPDNLTTLSTADPTGRQG